MKRLAALLLAAAWLGPTARAADPTLVPTTPQVPMPRLDNGSVIPASGFGDRVLVPLRERVALAIAPTLTTKSGAQVAAAPVMPLPTGYAPAGGCATGECASGGCGGQSRGCLERFKAWLCFCPTAGDALPKLRPAPYVGPITGTFPCHSAGCYGGNGCAAVGACGAAGGACANGNGNGCGNGGNGIGRGNGGVGGCAANGLGKTGRGGLGMGLLGHGCKGECVPPPENPFPGYKFAFPESPAVTGRPPASVTSTSYKPSEMKQ